MKRRHLFGLVAAAFAAPFVKPAPSTPRPFAFMMSEHSSEFILPRGFAWPNVPGYASSMHVSNPIEISPPRERVSMQYYSQFAKRVETRIFTVPTGRADDIVATGNQLDDGYTFRRV